MSSMSTRTPSQPTASSTWSMISTLNMKLAKRKYEIANGNAPLVAKCLSLSSTWMSIWSPYWMTGGGGGCNISDYRAAAALRNLVAQQLPFVVRVACRECHPCDPQLRCSNLAWDFKKHSWPNTRQPLCCRLLMQAVADCTKASYPPDARDLN